VSDASSSADPDRAAARALAAAFDRFIHALIRQRGMGSSPHVMLLTPSQSMALDDVVERGPMRLGTLADRIGTTDATATRTVDALEELSLVERAPDPRDRRGVRIAATDRGRLSAAERKERLLELLGDAIEGASCDEVGRFVELFDDLAERLDPAHHRSSI
jgi:DNA-binding MarR family transcriptional regulator